MYVLQTSRSLSYTDPGLDITSISTRMLYGLSLQKTTKVRSLVNLSHQRVGRILADCVP